MHAEGRAQLNHERVVDWQEGRSYRIEVFGGTMPMDDLVAELAVTPDGAGSLLRMTMTYRPRWGRFGRVIEPILLRPNDAPHDAQGDRGPRGKGRGW
jgi:hypothetical protein